MCFAFLIPSYSAINNLAVLGSVLNMYALRRPPFGVQNTLDTFNPTPKVPEIDYQILSCEQAA
tara:strand:+ start:21232 stop:21420 length:189 start_codon:yes stop_codon:yes gene_type:complete